MTAAWLAALAALAYLPSLAGVFQFDDYNVIVNEPAVHSWAAFFERATGVRPLLKASYTLSWTLGPGALGFHVLNIAVHSLNTALVYAVGVRLCRHWSGPSRAGAEPSFAPLAAALLFALHPVQVEAVTYISGRSSSLVAAFYLGAVLAYLRGARWTISVPLFALALATKETAVTLPAALALCDWTTKGRVDWRRQAPHWGLVLAAGAFMVANPRYLELLSFGFARRDLADHLPTQIAGVSYLVARLVGFQGPNIDPALPVLQAWDASLALQAALLGVLLAAGLVLARRLPWAGFGVLWFFLHLAPTNSVIPRLDVANDRQLYLAGWGLFLALAVPLSSLPRISAAALALACVAGSIPRQLDYRSEIALWEADTRRAPWNARAHNNLGYAYEQAGRVDEARRAYDTALRLDPGHLKARMNRRRLAVSD